MCNKNMILIKMWLVRFIRVMQLAFFFFFNSLNLTNFPQNSWLSFPEEIIHLKLKTCFHVYFTKFVFIYKCWIMQWLYWPFIPIMMITIFYFSIWFKMSFQGGHGAFMSSFWWQFQLKGCINGFIGKIQDFSFFV